MADRVAGAIQELFRVAPSAFTRHRDATAAALRKAGQSAQAEAISRLRRPSLSLWATNQLAHEEAELLAEFVDAVERVVRLQLRDPRAAAEALQQQRAKLETLVSRAADLLARHGHGASPVAARRISDTLLGAAVDRDRSRELRQGRLTEELSAPGFEVLAGTPRSSHLRVVPKSQEPRSSAAGAANAERRASAERRAESERRSESERQAEAERRAEGERRRQQRDREAAELERAAAERQAAVSQMAREAEDLERRLGEARARLREAQQISRAATTRARQARRRTSR